MKFKGKAKRILLFIGIMTVCFLGIESSGQTAEPTPVTNFQPVKGVCSGHGGVNCTINNVIKREVTCNDGTTVSQVSMWETEDCQSKLSEDLNFSFENSCVPPDEFSGCKDSAGREAVRKALEDIGVLDSELGKNEMAVCENQIRHHEEVTRIFQECFSNAKKSVTATRGIFDVLLSYLFKFAPGKDGLCSVTTGEDSFFNTQTKSCQCKSGFYLKDSMTEITECLSGLEMCQYLHGENVVEKNGNCVCAEGYGGLGGSCLKIAQSTVSPKPTFNWTTPKLTPDPTPIFAKPLPEQYPSVSPLPVQVTTTPTSQDKNEESGIFVKLFSWVIRLFCLGLCK